MHFHPVMKKQTLTTILILTLSTLTFSCASKDKKEEGSSSATGNAAEMNVYGANPYLPEPEVKRIPTVKMPKPVGWGDHKPQAAKDLPVVPYATKLNHPRWLYVLPNGDVLVAETNAPKPHDDDGRFKYKLMKAAMRSKKSPDQITLLRGTGEDGQAKLRTVFLDNLHSPFGMALIGNDFYVANTDAIWKYPYKSDDTRIEMPGEKIVNLPAGQINHHWTKNILPSQDGKKLYVTVGSNSNIADNPDMSNEVNRASILEVDLATKQTRVFASGLRNPVGLGWEPQTGILWTAVNERDELGDDLVPDYMTAVRDGDFFGWPYSYFGQHLDPRVKPQNPQMVQKARSPDYALGSHTASMGLAFVEKSPSLPQFSNGVFIAQHGSWNRKELSGYKVIFVQFEKGRPVGQPQDVLTGFLTEYGRVRGRPVGVAIDKEGMLLVADDVGNVIWKAYGAGKLAKNSFILSQ